MLRSIGMTGTGKYCDALTTVQSVQYKLRGGSATSDVNKTKLLRSRPTI